MLNHPLSSSSQNSLTSDPVETRLIPVDSVDKENDLSSLVGNDEKEDGNMDEELKAAIALSLNTPQIDKPEPSPFSEILERNEKEEEKEEDKEQLQKKLFLALRENNLAEFKRLIESDKDWLYATDDKGNTLIDVIITHHQDTIAGKDYTEMVKFLVQYGVPRTGSVYKSIAELAQSFGNKIKLAAILERAEKEELRKIIQHSLEQFSINHALIKKRESEEEQSSHYFTLSDNRHYYWLVSNEVKKLKSLCLADTWLGSEELIDYLAQRTHDHQQVAVSITVWDTERREDGFPLESFLNFLSNPGKNTLILPIMYQRHFCGLLFRKKTPAHVLEIEYFNPSTDAVAPGGNDIHNLEQVRHILFDVMRQICVSSHEIRGIEVTIDESTLKIITEQFGALTRSDDILIANSSHQQQFNGSDCGYIVGQTLIEKALELPTTIPSYTTASSMDYARSIAQARANCYDADILSEKKAHQLIKEQYLWRMTKAITWLESEASPLRKLIQLVPSLSGDDDLLFQVLKNRVAELEKGLLKSLSPDEIPEHVLKQLRVDTKRYELRAIQGFCDRLLQPYFTDSGDPTLIAHREFLKHLPMKIKSQFPELTDKIPSSYQQQTSHRYHSGSHTQATATKVKPSHSELINVSGQGSHCGLFALALGAKLALAARPELADRVHIPDFVLKFPDDLLIASNVEVILDEEKEARLASIGLTLRQALAIALRNNTQYKNKRYENFLAICVQHLKGDNSPLPQEMVALFQADSTKEFLLTLSDEWKQLEIKLALQNAAWTKEFLPILNQVSIDEGEIADSHHRLIAGLEAEKIDSVEVFFQRIAEEIKNPLQCLIKSHKLYQAAWSKVTTEGSSPKRKLMAEKVRKYFVKEAIKIITQKQPLDTDVLQTLVLLDQTTFDVTGEIKQVTSNNLLIETFLYYFAEFFSSTEWKKIYGAYCQEIGKTSVMLTSEELGELATSWRVQLIIDFQDSTREPYQSFPQKKESMLQVTLCNPINQETGTQIHWQVVTDTEERPPVAKRFSTKSSPSTQLFKGLFHQKAAPEKPSAPPLVEPTTGRQILSVQTDPLLAEAAKQAATLLMQASQEDGEQKELLLKQTSKAYVALLKMAYQESNPYYYYQTWGFKGLGEVYCQRQDYINAIALYNFALAICRDEKKNVSFKGSLETDTKALIDAIKKAEKQFLFSITGKEFESSPHELDQAHQDYLKNIRDEARAKLTQHQALTEMLTLRLSSNISRLDRIRYVAQHLEEAHLSVQQISLDISEQMRGLVRLLIEECMQVLGAAPCDYAIICFGSLARDEATPYSDLEFGVLIGEGQDTEENKQYFRNLTKLLNIKVINLGETTPRMQYIEPLKEVGLLDRYSDSPIRNGFSYDGNNQDGCKTPLGNKHFNSIPENERYELILTPKQMAQLHNEEWYGRDKHLSTVLMTAKCLDGDSNLCEEYLQETRIILSAYVVEENRKGFCQADKVLMKKQIQIQSLALLVENNERFQFRGGIFSEETHFFDVKYHLYRQPNMMIDHLAGYFEVTKTSLWDRIDSLFGTGGRVENKSAVINLKYIVSIILSLRLVTYLNKNCRDNHIFGLNLKHPEKNQDLITKHLGIDQGLLLQIYRVLIPLQRAVEKFVRQEGTDDALVKHDYYDDSLSVKGWIHKLLLNYVPATQIYIQAKQVKIAVYGEEHHSVAETASDLGLIYAEQARYNEAITEFKEAKRIFINLYSNNYPAVASILVNLGLVYAEQEYYGHALGVFIKAQQIYITVYGEKSIVVAEVQNKLGDIYQAQSLYPEALAMYVKAENIFKEKYGQKSIPMARVLMGLGNMYCSQGDYKKALELHKQAQQIFIAEHGSNHPSVALSLNYLGNVYHRQADYTKAIKIYETAIEIYIAVYGKNHGSVVRTLDSLGNIYIAMGNYSDAIAIFKEAKRIKIGIYGNDHISVAEISFRLANLYVSQKSYDEAIAAYEEALQMYRQTDSKNYLFIKLIEKKLESVKEINNCIVTQDNNPGCIEVPHPMQPPKTVSFENKAVEKKQEKAYDNSNVNQDKSSISSTHPQNIEIDSRNVTTAVFEFQKFFKTGCKALREQQFQLANENLNQAYELARRANYSFYEIRCLRKLAELFLKKEQEISDLYFPKKDYITAAKFAHAAATLCNHVIQKSLTSTVSQTDSEATSDTSHDFDSEKEKIEHLCLKIETAFIEEYLERTPPLKRENTEINSRDALNLLRQNIERLVDSEGNIQDILQNITDTFVKITQSLIQACFTIMNRAPCDYTVMGFGLMSQKELYPYSSITLAILIKKDNELIRGYFTQLMKFLEFKFIFLGETVCSQLLGGWKTARLPRNGLRLDPSIATSLPIIINTPQKLAGYQSQVKQLTMDERYLFLCDSLRTVCYLAGGAALFESYEKEKAAILNSRFSFLNSQLTREVYALGRVEQMLARHKFSLSQHERRTDFFNINEALHRFLREVILQLTAFYGFPCQGTWDMLAKLQRENIISESAAKNLNQALQQIVRYRIKTHLYYGEENDKVYYQEAIIASQTSLINDKLYPINSNDVENFIEIYKVVNALYVATQAFWKSQGQINPFMQNELYDHDLLTRGQIFEQMYQFKLAKKAYMQLIHIIPNDISLLTALRRVFMCIGNQKKALNYCSRVAELTKNDFGMRSAEFAECLFHLSLTNYVCRKYREAKERINENLTILDKLYRETPSKTIEVEGIKSLRLLGNIYASTGKYEKARNLLEQILQSFKPEYMQVIPDIRESIRHDLANIYGKLGDHGRKKVLLKEVLRFFEAKDVPFETRVSLLVNLGNAYGQLGNYQKKMELMEDAYNRIKYVFDYTHPTVAEVQINLGNVYIDLKRFEDAQSLLEQALRATVEMCGEKHIDVASVLHSLGNVYLGLNDLSNALNRFHSAYAIFEKELGEEHFLTQRCQASIRQCQRASVNYYLEYFDQIFKMPRRRSTLGSIFSILGGESPANRLIDQIKELVPIAPQKPSDRFGMLYAAYENANEIGDYKHAKVCLDEILSIEEKSDNKDPRSMVSLLFELGSCNQSLADYQQAKIYQERGLAIYHRQTDKNDEDLIFMIGDLAKTYAELHLQEAAEELLKQALGIGERIYGNKNSKMASLWISLGVMHYFQRKYSEAKTSLQYGLNILESASEEERLEYKIVIADAFANLGATLMALAKHPEAKVFLERALIMTEEMLSKNHPRIVVILTNLSKVECILKNVQQALDYSKRAHWIAQIQYGEMHPSTLFAGKQMAECESRLASTATEIVVEENLNQNSNYVPVCIELKEEFVRKMIGPRLQYAYQHSPNTDVGLRFDDGITDAGIVRKVTRVCQHYFDNRVQFWQQSVRPTFNSQTTNTDEGYNYITKSKMA